MERQRVYEPKVLSLTYQEYKKRGYTIQNLVIDKYVIYDLIGVGSYGSVFSGMDDKTKKQVAVKVLDMQKMKAEKNEVIKKIKLRLAESEPRLMYQCESPYLLKCFDVYENQDLKIMVIEYCSGKTLQAQIDAKGRIPENEAWVILKHIINGLMELHKYNIIHRDLKAENIMSHNGTYKIIDFGFSKKLQISQESAQVRNTSLGTITTMAPEVMGRKPYGLKADIWSLGIIFFQMIYGTYPYDSVTAAQMYREIQAKKLFNKEEPFTHNGYTPSKDAYNFLRFTIVVDTASRPDWKAVSEYPNIKNTDNEVLNQRFIKHCDINVQKDLDYRDNFDENSADQKIKSPGQKSVESPIKRPQKSAERKQEVGKRNEEDLLKEKKKQQDTMQHIKKMREEEEKKMLEEKKKKVLEEKEKKVLEEKERKEREQFQREVKRIEEEERKQEERKRLEREKERQRQRIQARIRDINQTQVRRKEQQINRDEDKEYQWTQEAHLECLKTQFIYREILYPLEISGTLDIEDRSSIEFYYLLSVRCFNNMSPINDQLEQRTRLGKNKDLISNLKVQITRLYNQVQKKFEDFSVKLTKSEDKTFSMIKDWFSKKLDKNNFKEKDRFLTGIQKIEYSKEEQIQFTMTYYNQKIREILSKAKNMSSVIKRMLYFKQIMMVSLNILRNKGKTFEEFVQDQLSGRE